MNYSILYLQINSLVALRDLDGLSGASSLPPYFFFDVVLVDDVSMLFDEMLDDNKELVVLLTVLFDELRDVELLSCCFVCDVDEVCCVRVIIGGGAGLSGDSM